MTKRPQHLTDLVAVPVPLITLRLRPPRAVPRFGKFAVQRLNLFGGVKQWAAERVPQLIA